MHNSKGARIKKEAKTGQIIRIEQKQLNNHLDKIIKINNTGSSLHLSK